MVNRAGCETFLCVLALLACKHSGPGVAARVDAGTLAPVVSASLRRARHWPLPPDCEIRTCQLPDGSPGVRCTAAEPCGNPCPAGMAPERNGMNCARRCGPGGCRGGTCNSEGICDRWPKPLRCEAPEMCRTPDRLDGLRCEAADPCTVPCKPGLILYGGTHCAKPCRAMADCPGGECSAGVCGPLCPTEGCPYRWE
jgi:hypothetical protein